ncbi:MAG TPA: hypothetical protein VNZ52_12500 [Candidatus Thermoplasmatota archaeon]|nr:hypothetical protein [Candidatus Thermoplasmatota archaeon]
MVGTLVEPASELSSSQPAEAEGVGPLARTALGLGVLAVLLTAVAIAFLPTTPGITVAALVVACGSASLACAVTAMALGRAATAERVRRLEREALVEEIQEMLSAFEERLYRAEAQAAEALGDRRKEAEAPPLRAARKHP